MKTPLLILAASACLPSAFAGYTYDYANLLNPYSSGQWVVNGDGSASNSMYTASSTGGGSLIWNGGSLPSPSTYYEIRTTLTLNVSGGSYISYLRADNGSQLAAGNTGTFYAAEIANPSISGNSCWATLNIYKQTGAGSLTLLTTTSIACHSGMVVRTVMAQGNGIIVYLDNSWTLSYYDGSPIAGGQPGVGVHDATGGNGISAIDIGHLDTIAPTPVDPQQVGTSSFPTHVDFQFPGAIDDANGTGVAYYQFWRGPNAQNMSWLNFTPKPEFSDTTVAANTTYTYWVQAVDYHNNSTLTTLTVATPPAGTIEIRRVGVHALGTYWGAAGEQIDTRSGNLNYTLPVFKVQGRGGWAVPFALSYNSQNWRQDPGGTWQLGRDIGYGYGWRMQAGSLTPVYSGYWGIAFYLYIDSTGAEYRLENVNNGVWTSNKGTYIAYDPSSQRLYFTDGSFWTMGCTSMGTETDAGTLYPTQMQDPNGNQVVLTYLQGLSAPGNNSSSRLQTIEDVRGQGSATYQFTYNTDPVPHLTAVAPAVTGVSETFNFVYGQGQSLSSPFSAQSYGATTLLSSVTGSTFGTRSLTYNGSAELTQATSQFGGSLRWDYTTNTYIGSRSQREVQTRYLRKAAGAAETSHTFSWDSGDTNTRPVHLITWLNDPATNTQKDWVFNTSMTGDWWNGVLNQFEERAAWFQYLNTTTVYWTTDGNGTPYVYARNTTLDNNTSNAVTTRSEQTLDTHGNLLTSSIYAYAAGNNPGALLRTYTNTYLTNTNYTSRYIFNRLQSTTVSGPGGSPSVGVTSYAYDQNSLTDLTNPAPREHDSAYNTSFLYRGNVTTQTALGKTVTRTYDITGNIKTASDGNLQVASATGSGSNYAVPTSMTPNGTGNLGVTYTYNGALEPTNVTMPNGASATASYDGTGQPTTTTSPYGAVTDYAYNYNSTASTVTATTHEPNLPNDPNRHWVRNTLDGFGRTIKVETGDAGTTKSVVDTVYGPCDCTPMGKVLQVSQPYAPGGSPVWTTYTYDGRGRTLTITKPDGSVTTYLYTGNVTKVTDAAGNWKTFTMDATGQPDPGHRTRPAARQRHHHLYLQPAQQAHPSPDAPRRQRHPDPHLHLRPKRPGRAPAERDQPGKRHRLLHLQFRRHPGHPHRCQESDRPIQL